MEAKPRDLPVGFAGRLLVSPTTYFTWPADGPDDQLSRWHWRPDAERALATSVVWSCLTVGAQLHPASWLSAGTGAGFCSLSGGNYRFGALPMHTPVMQVNVRATKAISDRMRVGAECSSHPTYLSKERFSVLHEQAGEDPRVGRWISPVQCGITIRANP